MSGDAVTEMTRNLQNVLSPTLQGLCFFQRKTVNWFRTGSGGQYLGKELQTWLKSRRTTHELATAYSPESNETTERLSRILLDIARSTVIAAPQKLPTGLWADATN